MSDAVQSSCARTAVSELPHRTRRACNTGIEFSRTSNRAVKTRAPSAVATSRVKRASQRCAPRAAPGITARVTAARDDGVVQTTCFTLDCLAASRTSHAWSQRPRRSCTRPSCGYAVPPGTKGSRTVAWHRVNGSYESMCRRHPSSCRFVVPAAVKMTRAQRFFRVAVRYPSFSAETPSCDWQCSIAFLVFLDPPSSYDARHVHECAC